MKERKILINYLLYCVWGLVICLVGISNVFAFNPSDFHVQTTLENKTTQYVSTTYLNSPVTNPRDSGYAFSDVFDVTYVIDNYSFSANKLYQLESHLTGQKITNSNVYTVTDNQHNQSCLISYSDSIMNNDAYPRWAFQCPQATNSISISITNSSGANLWSGSGIFNWVSSVLWVTDNYTLDGTTDSSDNIINNANQNADRIINNQNQNTQDVINSQKACVNKTVTINSSNFSDFSYGYLQDNGTIYSNTTGSVISDYITINENTSYSISVNYTANAPSYCFYKEDKTLISCARYSQSRLITFTSPANSFYIRISAYNGTSDITTLTGAYCTNGNQVITDSINSLKESIDDDDIDTTEATDFFDNFDDNTHGLSGIISAPLVAINSMLNNQCSPLTATWRGQTVSLPCGYDMWTRFSTFKQFLNIVLDGLICYRILIKLFKLVEKAKNPDDDRVEVMDL